MKENNHSVITPPPLHTDTHTDGPSQRKVPLGYPTSSHRLLPVLIAGLAAFLALSLFPSALYAQLPWYNYNDKIEGWDDYHIWGNSPLGLGIASPAMGATVAILCDLPTDPPIVGDSPDATGQTVFVQSTNTPFVPADYFHTVVSDTDSFTPTGGDPYYFSNSYRWSSPNHLDIFLPTPHTLPLSWTDRHSAWEPLYDDGYDYASGLSTVALDISNTGFGSGTGSAAVLMENRLRQQLSWEPPYWTAYEFDEGKPWSYVEPDTSYLGTNSYIDIPGVYDWPLVASTYIQPVAMDIILDSSGGPHIIVACNQSVLIDAIASACLPSSEQVPPFCWTCSPGLSFIVNGTPQDSAETYGNQVTLKCGNQIPANPWVRVDLPVHRIQGNMPTFTLSSTTTDIN